MTLNILKNLKSLSKCQIENMEENEKIFTELSKMRMEILQEKQKKIEQDLRIKKLKSITDLQSLKQWINKNLTENEAIIFFVDKKCIKELEVTVTKKKDLYNISLGNKNLGQLFYNQLFLNFTAILEVSHLKNILIYKTELYYKLKNEPNVPNVHGSMLPNPW